METHLRFGVCRVVGRKRDDAIDITVKIQLRGIHRHAQNGFTIWGNRILIDSGFGTSTRRCHLIDFQRISALIPHGISEFDELLGAFAQVLRGWLDHNSRRRAGARHEYERHQNDAQAHQVHQNVLKSGCQDFTSENGLTRMTIPNLWQDVMRQMAHRICSENTPFGGCALGRLLL